MNHRNTKRVKDPKACASCVNCVKELNGARPTTYRCSVTPIVAGEKVCEKSTPLQKQSKGKGTPESADENRENVINNVVGPLLCRAHNYLDDLKNLNDRLSVDSAVRLLYAALTDIKTVAGMLEINVEG